MEQNLAAVNSVYTIKYKKLLGKDAIDKTQGGNNYEN
jgi:hypothetical protein